MVPPLRVSEADSPAIARLGIQRTYVFHRDGIETIALRPGFEGSIDDFGMLIPFPSPPAIRKIDDQTFEHIEGAIAPPSVRLTIRQIYPQLQSGIGGLLGTRGSADLSIGATGSSSSGGGGLSYHQVRVVREEAVGMYQVAVLEAGSPAALSRWMGDSGYRYPDGMDKVTAEYVASGWCFVAIKARVGAADQVTATPGMRSADPTLPAGSRFSGHIQGMAFRFYSDEPVVPMRLSVFNGADPHNVVYMLSERPLVVAGLPATVQVSHLDGRTLLKNLTEPLPMRIESGQYSWLDEPHRQQVEARRDPTPFVRAARGLIADDLLAVRTGALSLAHEEEEKALLSISEALGLRGPEIDALHAGVTEQARQRAADGALGDLAEMHLTVMSGVFPEPLLRDADLSFEPARTDLLAPVTHFDPLRRDDITGYATINTADGTTSLSWQQVAYRQVAIQLAMPTLTSLTGPRSDDEIRRVIARQRGALRSCFERFAQSGAAHSGTMGVGLYISAEGRVRSVSITQAVGGNALSQCLHSRFKRMRFPSADDVSTAELLLTFRAQF
ncbi:MAG: hypothetical protein ACI8S6_002414 [Myxococcota bacterium]|jgi:hypothetical protein